LHRRPAAIARPAWVPESRAKYDKLIGAWLANKRQLPADVPAAIGPTIAVIIQRFWTHAETYYRKPDGTPTTELKNFQLTLRHLNRLHGDMPAARFGPNALRAWRDSLTGACQYTHPTTGAVVAKRDWSRTYVNKQTNRIKQLFKWAASRELVPIAAYEALRTLEGLKRGRTTARETDAVKPVAEGIVEAILHRLPGPVRALVELEALTGARGGELLIMRRCDLDDSAAVWIYKLAAHKGQWRNQAREIPLGPRCQDVIRPFLKVNAQAYLFSPADAEADRLAKRHAQRKTPLGYGNAPGTNRSPAPKRPAGDRYTPDSFRHAIQRTCEIVFPPPPAIARGCVKTGKKRSRRETNAEWEKRIGPEAFRQAMSWRREHRFHPHELRHTAATKLRKLFGLEAAGVVLGHNSLDATQIYAEANRELAISVMGKIG
jgi:integrase